MNSLSRSFGIVSRSTKNYSPAAFFHLSSVISRESVVDKTKEAAKSVNKEAGRKALDALDSAENLTGAAAEKVHDLKNNSVVDKAKSMAETVNKEAGKKVNTVIDGAENATKFAAEKTKGLKDEAEKHSDSEKTIVDTIIGGVEAAKKAVGLGSKKSNHEVKDKAKSKANKAAKNIDKASEYAKDTKSKASGFVQDAKEKASNAAEDVKDKAEDTANKAQEKAKDAADYMKH